jgi:hypothetical protein
LVISDSGISEKFTPVSDEEILLGCPPGGVINAKNVVDDGGNLLFLGLRCLM